MHLQRQQNLKKASELFLLGKQYFQSGEYAAADQTYKQAQALRAEGFSKALEQIYAAAKSVDQKTMTLQYFETLKAIGASPSTKYIFPMEFTSMLDNFLGKSGKG
jgi:hypothetical protein